MWGGGGLSQFYVSLSLSLSFILSLFCVCLSMFFLDVSRSLGFRPRAYAFFNLRGLGWDLLSFCIKKERKKSRFTLSHIVFQGQKIANTEFTFTTFSLADKCDRLQTERGYKESEIERHRKNVVVVLYYYY
jgi:hypothetical protein